MANNDIELNKLIGSAIAKYRVAAGMTQAQVAEKLNISNEAVSRMERGTIMPTVARLIQLAEIFQCSAANLLIDSSHALNDQSQKLNELLAQLNENERIKLMEIIEMMIAWRKIS